MRKAATLWALPFIVLTSASALADVPNDPCMGATAGDPCTTLDGQDGTCVDVNGFLTCEEPSATGSGGSGTTTGSGVTTAGSGGNGGNGDGDSEDGGGCSASGVGATTSGTMGLLALLGLAFAHRRRR
ncbi:MAG TPA: hypothetical protein ENK57_14940 [Polyangiaceae bacterium]|nr:hypothetical protein [Polyangiaceae bacterium]